jgi:D-alanyl-D-alanine carboxypeptidase
MPSKTFFLTMTLLLLQACAIEPKPQLHVNPIRAIENELQAILEDGQTPGMQYILLSADSIIMNRSYGMASLSDSTAMQAKHTFHGFSITKVFTALAIIDLAEAGQVHLDSSVAVYLPEYHFAHRIKVHHLLNHTSGLGNPLPINWIHPDTSHDKFDYAQFDRTILSEVAGEASPPGLRFSYSNPAYIALGLIIERVSGQSYDAYLEQYYFPDWCQREGAYLGFQLALQQRHAHGYIRRWSWLNLGMEFVFAKDKYYGDTYAGWTEFKHFYVNGRAYGGIIANSTGLAGFLQSLLQRAKADSNWVFLQLRAAAAVSDFPVANAWFQGAIDGFPYLYHAGGGGGYYCEIRVYPQANLASAIFFNRTGVSRENILDQIDIKFLSARSSE